MHDIDYCFEMIILCMFVPDLSKGLNSVMNEINSYEPPTEDSPLWKRNLYVKWTTMQDSSGPLMAGPWNNPRKLIEWGWKTITFRHIHKSRLEFEPIFQRPGSFLEAEDETFD